MSDRQSLMRFLLGTSVKVTALLNVDTVTSAAVTIKDPANVEKVIDGSMTNTANKVYTYIWQSPEDGVEGDYIVTISITQGAYTTVKQARFTLVRQE